MIQRRYGRTQDHLSVVGFGGVILMDYSPEQAASVVAKAVDRGINYFDISPTYGNAIERLGPALEPFRNSVFLACKTIQREAGAASQELKESLETLRTDHVDLFQMHAVDKMEDVETVLAPGGAVEVLSQAKKDGITRYIGFSSHSEEAALSLMERYDFDSILFPINWACWYKNGFGVRVLEKAKNKGMGILAIKALAKRRRDKAEPNPMPKCWYAPVDTQEEASLALRFTLSQPVTAAVSSGEEILLWWACDAADDLGPLNRDDVERLQKAADEVAPIFPK